MRVLGIDPGSRFMGYGVMERQGRDLRHIAHGVLKAHPDDPLEHRLHKLYAELTAAIKLYTPDVVAVEGVFSCRNPRSALILGHARGVALLASAQAGLSVFEYPPASVKRAVGASGAAEKGGVERMVRMLLRVSEIERADASDALAIAICHLNRTSLVRAAKSGKAPTVPFKDRLAPAVERYGEKR